MASSMSVSMYLNCMITKYEQEEIQLKYVSEK